MNEVRTGHGKVVTARRRQTPSVLVDPVPGEMKRGPASDRIAGIGTSIFTEITALATYLPPRLLTNADLEKMVDTSSEWILQRTGIIERHIVDPGTATSDLGKEAALKAVEQAGLSPDDIDLVIVGTTTPDMFFPSTAALIQDKIGAKHAWGFDLAGACSGFTFALATASQLVSTGRHEHALVVGADVMSSIIDYQDRATCVLFGDGAGAAVVSAAKDPALAILDFAHEIDGRARERRMAQHANAKDIPRDRNRFRAVAQMARDMMEECRDFRAPEPKRGRELEDVVSLVRIERPELVAEHRLVVHVARQASPHVVDDVDVAAEMNVPRVPNVIVRQRRRRQLKVVSR